MVTLADDVKQITGNYARSSPSSSRGVISSMFLFLLSLFLSLSLSLFRTGPCYTKVKNGQCLANLQGVVCTRQLCCATVGKGWGHPCERCPARLDCELGHLKTNQGQCVGKWSPFIQIPISMKWVTFLIVCCIYYNEHLAFLFWKWPKFIPPPPSQK